MSELPRHHSTERAPADRGAGLGRAHGERIHAALGTYEQLFAGYGLSQTDVAALGEQALERIDELDPDLRAEIEGIAAGSGTDLALLGALNARTEVLAGHECTTVACLGDVTRDGGALGAQTWDWHRELASAAIVWTIEHADGRRVQTLTEAGIVGKIGVSDAGVGVLLNILGHRDDGPPIGAPVHALARHVLDHATGPVEALQILAIAKVSASSAVTVVADDADGGVVCSVELWPGGPGFVTPNAEGRLVHTNHFLTHPAAEGDTMVRLGPDSVLRHDLAGRRLARLQAGTIDTDALREVLTSHRGGPGAICAHPPEGAALGDGWQTLATVTVDPANRILDVRPGGPCGQVLSTAAAARQSASRQGSPAS
jgi:isopenicillin-N N-acyltransferase-like protein